jgi:phenylalanyl-tRNA synthetase beta chain
MLSNPLSEDQSAMRTMLLGSLLDVASRNVARGANRLALFEAASVYLNHPPTGRKVEPRSTNRPVGWLAGEFPGRRPAPVTEPHRFGCLVVGPLTPPSWRGDGEPADFFALRGVAEALAGQLGAHLDFAAASEPFLHPGRSARVSVGGEAAGWIGEVHPLVCRAWDLKAAVACEIDTAPLLAAAGAGEETYEDVTTFPAAYRDLAVVVPIELAAADVREAVLAGGGELLRSAEVFDLYRGEQLGEGQKSLALSLEFRAADRTLTDEEVDRALEAIAAKLGEIGGSPRE